jgi:hypothetical protein
MPVQTNIDALSTTPSSNSPAGSESAALVDDYLRQLAAHIATLRDRVAAGSADMTAVNAAITAAFVTHNAASDPHPGYQTQAESDARYVRTVNGSAPDGSGNVVVSGSGGSALPTAIAPVTAIPLDGTKVFNADTAMSSTPLTIAAGQVEGGSCSFVVKGDGSSTWGGITGALKANGAATFSNTLNAVNHVLVWVDRGRVRYTVSQSDPIEIASASVAPTTAAPTIINSVVGQALTWTAGAMTGSPTPTATFNLRQLSTAIASAISNGAYVPQVAAGTYQLDQVAANGVSPNATATATVTLTAQPYAVSGGASGGVVSAASPAFTLTVSGVLAASTVITPSDSGGGGTFTPATVTIAPGTNPTGTFTYTPSATPGARTISFTNSAALANPSSITYTSTATLSVPTNTSAPQIATGSTARPVGYSQSSLTGSWTNSPTSYLYKWQRSTDGGVSWADISGATASTYTLVDADAGNVHRVGVAGVNAAGTSAYTYSAASAVVTAIAPGAPTVSAATSITTTGLTYTYADPASNGGSAITSRNADISFDGGATWTAITAPTVGSNTITFASDPAARTAQIRARATNAIGPGGYGTLTGISVPAAAAVVAPLTSILTMSGGAPSGADGAYSANGAGAGGSTGSSVSASGDFDLRLAIPANAAPSGTIKLQVYNSAYSSEFTYVGRGGGAIKSGWGNIFTVADSIAVILRITRVGTTVTAYYAVDSGSPSWIVAATPQDAVANSAALKPGISFGSATASVTATLTGQGFA